MWQLHPAGVEQEETIKDALGLDMSCDAVLHLLRVYLTLLLRTISDFVSVLHFGLLLFNLNHTIQIGRFHGQYMHIVPFVDYSFCLACAWNSSLAPKITIILLRWCWVRII